MVKGLGGSGVKAPRLRDPACAGEFGKRPYYAPNPLRGGATKGGRGLGIKGLRD